MPDGYHACHDDRMRASTHSLVHIRPLVRKLRLRKMFFVKRGRVRRRLTVFLLFAALVPLRTPRRQAQYVRSRLSHIVGRDEVAWSKQRAFILFLLNPQSIAYIVLFTALLLLTCVSVLAVFFESIFFICNFLMHFGTSKCRLPANHHQPTT